MHKSHGPNGSNVKVLKECSSQISSILALINKSLAQSNVPADWRQTNVSPVFKKEKHVVLQTRDPCR